MEDGGGVGRGREEGEGGKWWRYDEGGGGGVCGGRRMVMRKKDTSGEAWGGWKCREGEGGMVRKEEGSGYHVTRFFFNSRDLSKSSTRKDNLRRRALFVPSPWRYDSSVV